MFTDIRAHRASASMFTRPLHMLAKWLSGLAGISAEMRDSLSPETIHSIGGHSVALPLQLTPSDPPWIYFLESVTLL